MFKDNYKKILLLILVLALCSSVIYFYQLYLTQRSISSYYLSNSLQEINNNAYLISKKIDLNKVSYSIEEIKEILDYHDRIVIEYTHLHRFSAENDPTIINPVKLYFNKSLENKVSSIETKSKIIKIDSEDLVTLTAIKEFSSSILEIYESIDNKYSEDMRLKKVMDFMQKITSQNKDLIKSLEDN